MTEPAVEPSPARERPDRRCGRLQATGLNMANMLGIEPFISIPLLMTAPLVVGGIAIACRFLFVTSDPIALVAGAGSLAAGVVAFLIWARRRRHRPFESSPA